MRTKLTTTSAVICLALSGTGFAAGPSATMLANACAGCHGTDGSSVGPSMPTIAGINADYFVDSMKAYKDGSRDSTIMGRIAKAYTEDDLKAMAGFFAKQPFVRFPQQHDAAKAKLGAKLHDEYCEKCHEKGGRQASEGGTLAGQWVPYLKFSMADFQSGAREMPKKMKRKVEDLHEAHGDVGIDALIQYYGSQK